MPASSGSFTVNKDNVLAAAKIIQTQAVILRDNLDDMREVLWIKHPGEDDVSIAVAAAWNYRLVGDGDDSYFIRIQQYVDGLDKLVRQLKDTANVYGYTDDEVAAAIGARSA
jgi:uncharacterized protein YukE